MELEIEPVHQAQRPELLLADLALHAALDLPAELGHAVLNEGVVEFVVAVHGV